MHNVTELIDRYIATWNETDPKRRRDLIAKTWTDDGSYVDAHRTGTGYENISTMIQGVQEQLPGYRLRLTSVGDREKPGAMPPSHRMSPALLDTNAIASSATPHSKRGFALAVKDGHRGRSTASAVSPPCACSRLD